jgi:hypothetical protein
MVRCVQPTPTAEGSSSLCLIDMFRDEMLLGWEGNYSDFIKVVIDVDSDHYNVFSIYDDAKVS